MVCLLPIPNKIRNIYLKRLDELWQTLREVLNKALQWVPQPLTIKPNPSAESVVTNLVK
jgi:hypothetical protein